MIALGPFCTHYVPPNFGNSKTKKSSRTTRIVDRCSSRNFDKLIDKSSFSRLQIFGPVQQILKFKTLDEVIDRANDTIFGLGSGVFTKDINKALTFAQCVQAGSVWYVHTSNHFFN